MSDDKKQLGQLDGKQIELLKLLLTEKMSKQTLLLPQSRENNVFPQSFAQQRLWLLDQLEEERSSYNEAFELTLTGELSIDALEESLNQLIHRHEVLHTVFRSLDGVPVQVLVPPFTLSIPIVDVSDTSVEEQKRSFDELTLKEKQVPFHLESGPLLRVKLFRFAPTKHVLLLVLHHIICDAWSNALLIQDWLRLYENEDQSLRPELQYVDYVKWQHDWSQTEVFRRQLAYWKHTLEGMPPLLSLPTDRPRPPVLSHRGGVQRFMVPLALTEKLKALGREEGVTLFMILQSLLSLFLSRCSGQEDICVGTPVANRGRAEFEQMLGLFMNIVVLRIKVNGNNTFRQHLHDVRERILDAQVNSEVPFERLVEELNPDRNQSHNPLFQVMLVLQNTPRATVQTLELSVNLRKVDTGFAKFDLSLFAEEQADGLAVTVEYSSDLFDAMTVKCWMESFLYLMEQSVRHPDKSLDEFQLVSIAERKRILNDWRAEGPVPELWLPEQWEHQVVMTPDAVALVHEDKEMTFRELNMRANQVAHMLLTLVPCPNSFIGISLERSPIMVIGMLGILKAGHTYVPLDPDYPEERLKYIVDDAGITLLLTSSFFAGVSWHEGLHVIQLDKPDHTWGVFAESNPLSSVSGENLAYLIYTSGSSGMPKGVMVTHSNVANFFLGMDEQIGCDERDVMLATTSISFDISVLELFWTLTRGVKVVLLTKDRLFGSNSIHERKMSFSLFYFANATSDNSHEDGYRLLLEGARFADQHGFEAVWTPERHFHKFGGLFPNPVVTSAALATITERVQLRAGSVVLPLHDPIRVVEEWSMVDRISGGRIGLSVASGWHADDFVLAPDAYGNRHKRMFEGVSTMRRLWAGETLSFQNGNGQECEVMTYPRPIQKQLPIWVTCAGSPETFRRAGEIGANVLTHLLGQSVETLESNIALYRKSLIQNGYDPHLFRVSLMLHTFIDENIETVRKKVSTPFREYLRTSIDLIQLIEPTQAMADRDSRYSQDEEVMEEMLDIAFERYFSTAALFGTPQSCKKQVEHLQAVGVDEIACLIDFGVQMDDVLSGLESLNKLRESCADYCGTYSLAHQAVAHEATMIQGTPSLFAMISSDPTTYDALKNIRKVMIGGEALPLSLVEKLKKEWTAQLYNMYGPTETTIWSSVHAVTGKESAMPIGRPIRNTQFSVLDHRKQMVPVSVPGELHISGAGVAQGYWHRPEMTREKFIEQVDEFSSNRFYSTGDIVRLRSDGGLELLGRNDQQVKIRGYRVELSEIEYVLTSHPQIREAMVVVRFSHTMDKQLVAYLVAIQNVVLITDELRRYVEERLPEFMVPTHFQFLDDMPRTANGKVDRNRLPNVVQENKVTAIYVAPRTPMEQRVAAIWADVLKVERVGVTDSFFTLGGHSLLAAHLFAKLSDEFNVNFPIGMIFKYSTVHRMVEAIQEAQLQHVDDDELAAMLLEIEQLSDEDVHSSLVSWDKTNGRGDQHE